jgi:hypothetical protein
MNYKLSPSDLTFLYNGCKHCFYQKVVNGIVQPSTPLPSIFSKIAGLLKDHYDGKHTSELHGDLPPGIITHGEKWVRSEPIKLPNHESTCYINGRFDIVASFDDGSYGVIDFKTSNPSTDSSRMYSRQLHAYAYALDHPAPGKLALSPVTKLGLLYFYPDNINQQSIDRLNYGAEIVWKEVEKDEQAFLSFIDEVLSVLELPKPPECSSDCQWCGYISKISMEN